MTDDLEKLNQILRPVARPRVLEGVYTDDQYERIMGVIQAQWPLADDHRSPFQHRRGTDGDLEWRGDDG